MTKLIIVNGPDLNPAWAGKIAFTYDFTGTNALNLLSAQAAGGFLISGDEYFYKVVAVVKRGLAVSGDNKGPFGAAQLSAWNLTGNLPEILFWKLQNNGAVTRVVTLSRDPYCMEVVAIGTRNGDGAITFTPQNDSGINGTVTVAYTADDADKNNTIGLKYNYYEGNEEAHQTIVAGTQIVNLSWDAVVGDVFYRIYRGSASGVYDGFFLSATNSYSDTGESLLSADEMIVKDDIKTVKGEYFPAVTTPLVEAAKSQLYIMYNDHHKQDLYIDLTSVSNQPGWNAGTPISTQQAENDFVSWL